jgi:hypothetical protein
MSYIGRQPKYYSLPSSNFTGNGSTVNFTLSFTPPSTAYTFVFVAGAQKIPGKNYNVTGTTLAFTSAPANGASIIAYGMGMTGTVSSPADNTVTTSKLGGDVTAYAKTLLVASSATAARGTLSAMADVTAGTSGNVLVSNGSIWQSTTPIANLIDGNNISPTGTNANFNNVPANTKRITISFSGISTNGTSVPLIRLGDSGGVSSTGYAAGVSDSGGIYADTTGFPLVKTLLAADILHGIIHLSKLGSTNTWALSGNIYRDSTTDTMNTSAGSKVLSNALTTVYITMVNGSDLFDAGTINVTYEV